MFAVFRNFFLPSGPYVNLFTVSFVIYSFEIIICQNRTNFGKLCGQAILAGQRGSG